jgi:hypothetical protein
MLAVSRPARVLREVCHKTDLVTALVLALDAIVVIALRQRRFVASARNLFVRYIPGLKRDPRCT